MRRKNNRVDRIRRAFAAACLFAAFGAGCGYFHITPRDDVGGGLYHSAVIMGMVEGDRDTAVMVIAWPENAAGKSIEYVVLDRPGSFQLYLPKGTYRLFALCDDNADGIFDSSESCGAGESTLSLAEGDVKADASIRISGRPALPVSCHVKEDTSFPRQVGNGTIAKIYDERFSRHNADIGWWSPSIFMKAFGARIYFSRQYQDETSPVLFVHGAQGSPQDWAYFHFKTDARRYQPWYYYYPSGMRLPIASRLLYENILDLRRRYRFSSICMTAHSMGGLVARDMLARHDLRKIGIDKVVFITLASPWSGFRSADRAKNMPSKKIPVWLDVGASSDFIARTLRAKLPANVRYYLFFGKEDSVAAERALDWRACEGTLGTYGFEADHDMILRDRAVYNQYSEIVRKELP